MKLLVFAHVPPPHHGQSYAVKLMLENFGGNRRKPAWAGHGPDHFGIECYHVNARYSKTLEDIGEFQGGKIFLILFYCLQAIWCRFRYGVEHFYYVPAPGKPVALYRDWLVMLVCRPFFKKIIFHWHAAGLAKWLETAVSIRTRSFTYRRMRDADLSIVLSEFNRRDAEKLTARRVAIVAGGIPDPCPQFETEILPRRRARVALFQKIMAGDRAMRDANGNDSIVNVLFLAHCTREKGAFDAIEGVVLANEKLAAENSPLRFRLTLIGAFASGAEEKELRDLIQRRGFQSTVECLGFVSTERKTQALAGADLFCFPTYHSAENQPGNLIEAMAFGLPIVTTRWRSVPEMLPPDYPGIVDPKSPGQIADLLRRLAVTDFAAPLRETFLRRFTIEQHLAGMAEAIRSVE
jgi:glycosyltransferase involved in cell wall biosynthesis